MHIEHQICRLDAKEPSPHQTILAPRNTVPSPTATRPRLPGKSAIVESAWNRYRIHLLERVWIAEVDIRVRSKENRLAG
jgi:hypothetical protein